MPETILMIHGMWCAGWCWEKYRSFFEKKGYHCLNPTLRFHDMNPEGTPDARLGTTSLLDYAEDLEREIQKLDVPPVIMGHSMGGLLAQILGSRGLARALVLLAPASPSGIMSLTPSVVKSFWSVMTRWGFWRKPMRQTFAEAVYSTMHLIPAGEQKELFDRYVFESGRAATEIGFWFFDSKGAARVDEARVTCPVLVVTGTQDRITPAAGVRKVAAKYRAVATHREFTGHAHWLIWEPGWPEIAGYVSEWLEQVLNKSR